eukprot:Phypoly_transcript_11412.p1 GENE.Phypoly_transcript_11412~~Phypoly_transcript_11412.p1  ORF type:complete len:404 (+),score=58.10 Phypoly_transcript_11412:55-1212(+)
MGNTPDIFGNVNTSIRSLLFATGNLNHAIDTFSIVAQKLEQKSKELQEKERKLIEIDRQLRIIKEELTQKDRLCTTIAAGLEKREQILLEREKQWEENEKKLSAETGDVVKLNVGGTRFVTNKSTLRLAGTYFERFISTNSQTPNEEFFIDRDPKHFGAILNYLREGEMRDKGWEPWEVEELTTEFEFFNIAFPSNLPRLPRQPNSLFGRGSTVPATLQDKLSHWLPGKNFHLLYKATRDGFTASDFHNLCDNQSTTVVVISSSGYIFGGYFPESWESNCKWKTHPESFIFTLTNPHSIPPTRYLLKPNDQYAVMNFSTPNRWCFSFGGGSDMIVCSDSHKEQHSHFNFPHSYLDTTGKGKDTFTGCAKFVTQEIEIYRAEIKPT